MSDREQSDRYFAKVEAAAYSLGQLLTLVRLTEYVHRERDLARAVADLHIALLGTDEERAALVARRASDTVALLGRDPEAVKDTEGGAR